MLSSGPSPAARGSFRVLLAIAALALLEGCRTYEAKPVDLAATERVFLETGTGDRLARALDGPSLAEFVGRLRAAPEEVASFDASDGFSSDEAVAIALVLNRDLRIARLEAGVAQAGAEHGGLWSDPVLGVDVSDVLGGTATGVEAIASIGLTLPVSGRLELEKERLGAQHAAALARVAADEWRIASETRRAFARRAAKAAQVAAAREAVEHADDVMRTIERLEEAGQVARIEARLFRIEDATLRARLAALEGELLVVSAELDQLLGLPPDPARRYLDAVTVAASDALDVATRRARLAAGPTIEVARAEHEVAERRLAEEIRAQWPDLEIAPGYGEQDGDRQLVLGLGISLPILNGNRRAIAEADAAREVARLRLEAGLEQALSSLATSESRLAAARVRREALEATLVPLVDLQYEEARAVARLGELDVLVLLECLKQQLDAKLELVGARLAESIAAIDVRETLGPEPPARAPDAGVAEIPEEKDS